VPRCCWKAEKEKREKLETELLDKGVSHWFIYEVLHFRVLCTNNRGTRAGMQGAERRERRRENCGCCEAAPLFLHPLWVTIVSFQEAQHTNVVFPL